MDIQKPIIEKIATLKNLPTLPHILLKLITACNKKNGALSEVARIVEKDPSLSVKILKLVNSAYYALPTKIESMDQAVALAGTNTIKNMAFCASVYEAFSKSSMNSRFDLKVFWWHSLQCAALSRLIAKKTNFEQSDEAFLCGLLHDIGKLVLWVNFGEEYGQLFADAGENSDRLLALENEFGANHCEVGAWLLRRWNLESFMADAVLYHHEPNERITSAFPLVKIIHGSNLLCRPSEEEQRDTSRLAGMLFKIDPTEIESLQVAADKETAEVAESLGIAIAKPQTREALPDVDEKKDEEKRDELRETVQDAALLLGMVQQLIEARDRQAIFKAVTSGLQILFDVQAVLFFLYDADKDAFLGASGSAEPRFSAIEDLVVPAQMDGSLLISSLRQKKPIHSFETDGDPSPTTILDDQIIGLMGREGMVCLPLVAYGEDVGLLVLGLDERDYPHLEKQFRLLSLFAGQVASALHVDQMRENRMKAIQKERIKACSTLARKVFHEVNNPLGIIKNYLRILGMKLSKLDVSHDEIPIISEEIDRVALILRQLATFTEESALGQERVNINELLTDLIKIVEESLLKTAKVTLHLDLEPELPFVKASKNGLKQVFINLIKNATDAMTQGGNLSIKTRYVDLSSPHVEAKEKNALKGYVEIMVSDDGPGVPDDILSKLFEPFVTSKGEGHSGLGLSIVHSLIQGFGGHIFCESTVDKGTTFKIEFPLAEKV